METEGPEKDSLKNILFFSVFLSSFVCVAGRGVVSVRICAMEVRGGCLVSRSIILCLIPFRQDLSMNLELSGNQQAPSILLTPHLTVLGLQVYTWPCLHGFWDLNSVHHAEPFPRPCLDFSRKVFVKIHTLV